MNFDLPLIGIVRGVEDVFFGELMASSFEAGLSVIEVTMNTPGAEAMVARYRHGVPAGAMLGMGTIRTLDEAKKAADAGAMFFVTPNTNSDVIAFAVNKNIPVIAGALTPTEIYAAWSAGASMIKVFPCNVFGPSYFKDLAGPFDTIPLVAVGGVTRENLKDYFDAGARAVGVNSALFGRQALLEKNCARIFDNVSAFVQMCRALQKQP